MNKKAFSMVEITLVVGILAIIVSISVVSYRDYNETSREASAKQNLDTLKRTLEIYEAKSRRSCRSGPVNKLHELKFTGNTEDFWGNTYHVNNITKKIYSFGANGIDDKGEKDDIYITYSGIDDGTITDPPRNFVASGVSGNIKLTWAIPSRSKNLTGYIIEKRKDRETIWNDITSAPIPPDSLQWTDHSSESSMIYYRIVAVYEEDQKSRPSQLAGWVSVIK